MARFGCVLQYPREELLRLGFPHAGKWNGDVFANAAPIVLELGCGRGEYTVGLAKSEPQRNFIGIDIKGARMWTGALWITFPDPQMQKVRKRLTSTRFLNLYRTILRPDGIVNLKTDSPFLYEYTRRLVGINGFEVLACTDNLYESGLVDPVTSIKTYYEQQWLSRGKQIKLISFRLPAGGDLQEPQADDIPRDDYRAIPRPSFPGVNK